MIQPTLSVQNNDHQRSTMLVNHLLGSIGVGSTSTTRDDNNIDETTVVLLSSLCTSCLRLLLSLRVTLGCLTLHFTSTSQGSMNFTSQQSLTEVHGCTFLEISFTQGLFIGERSSSVREN